MNKKKQILTAETPYEKFGLLSRGKFFSMFGALVASAVGVSSCKDEDEHTVTYNRNNGMPLLYQRVANGKPVTEPTVPTLENHVFDGWYEDDGTWNKRWDFATPVIADLALHAKWSANTYKVTFISAGGTEVEEQEITHGEKITEPIPPTREGYTFAGWYTDNNRFENAWNFDTPVTQAATLFAKWDEIEKEEEKEYSVSYDLAEGTFTVFSNRAILSGTTVSLPAPERRGWRFDGWFNTENNANNFTGGDDGSGNEGRLTNAAEAGEESALYETNNNAPLYAAAAGNGANSAGSKTETWQPTDNFQVWARWLPNSVIFRYNVNIPEGVKGLKGHEAVGMPEEQLIVLETNSQTQLPTPTLLGHSFEGWQVRDANGDMQVLTVRDGVPTINSSIYAIQHYCTTNGLWNIAVNNDTPVDVYARWRGYSYDFLYVSNTGGVSHNDLPRIYGEERTFRTILADDLGYTRAGYTFAGWAFTHDATEAAEGFGPHDVSIFGWESDFHITEEGTIFNLFAVWLKNDIVWSDTVPDGWADARTLPDATHYVYYSSTFFGRASVPVAVKYPDGTDVPTGYSFAGTITSYNIADIEGARHPALTGNQVVPGVTLYTIALNGLPNMNVTGFSDVYSNGIYTFKFIIVAMANNGNTSLPLEFQISIDASMLPPPLLPHHHSCSCNLCVDLP